MTSSNPRIALVTGATAGIGEAVARKFAENGMKLVLAARRREKLETIAESLGTECHILELDIRTALQSTKVLVAFLKNFLRLMYWLIMRV